MQCPSCGAVSEVSTSCNECGWRPTDCQEQTVALANSERLVTMNSAGEVSNQQSRKSSTLIEFPGVIRSTVPEWRKELSERVREVQERRAREAAREAAEAEQKRTENEASPPPLELLPQAELPPINPLVAAALRRIERAHQTVPAEARQARTSVATAVAYAPSREEHEPQPEPIIAALPQLEFEPVVQTTAPDVVTEPKLEKPHGLVVVSSTPLVEVKLDLPTPAPRRLIIDDDPVLNYLDSIARTVRVDDIETKHASLFKRFVCNIFDLAICVLITSPILGAMKWTGTDLHDPRAIGVLAVSAIVMTFIYLTLTTALTGRTWAMRLFGLRIIDKKTGLIPTGSQSVGRSFFYLVSLAAAGLGILFAVVSREHNTAHDTLTRTAVIGT